MSDSAGTGGAAPGPCHILISFAYLRRASWIDPDQFAEATWFMVDSGAFTNHGKDLSHAKKGLRNPMPITLGEYCDWLKARGDHLYGAVALDRIGDEETTVRNLYDMVDRGLKPIPVITVDQDAERVNEYRRINPIICAPSGFGKVYTEEYRAKRFKALADAADGPVYLHGLGYTRYPGLVHTALHSADSSSYLAGQRYGSAYWFSVKGLRNVHWSEVTPDMVTGFLPLKLDYVAFKTGQPGQIKGDVSAIAATSGLAYTKFQRIAWLRGKRLFLASSALNDTRLALASYWCINVDPRPRTLQEFNELRSDIMSEREIREPYFSVMKRIKEAAARPPVSKVPA